MWGRREYRSYVHKAAALIDISSSAAVLGVTSQNWGLSFTPDSYSSRGFIVKKECPSCQSLLVPGLLGDGSVFSYESKLLIKITQQIFSSDCRMIE
jgi:hypothetical protein